jgi:hypothetical protein
LKLQYDETLSSFAFNFNLRRYNKPNSGKLEMELPLDDHEAGAYTRPLPAQPEPFLVPEATAIVHF